jgi:S-adenosylmethionine-dependent methyltransferase
MPAAALVSAVVGTDLSGDTTVPRGQSPLLWTSLQSILSRHEGVDPIRVLDCGGGSGSLAVPLAAQGADVTVVDVSVDALSTLLRRATEAGVASRVTAVQGEAESLSELVPIDHFDLVLAHEVLENVASLPAGLQQIVSVLRPGGATSVVVGNPVAVVLGRALAGDVAGALAALRRPAHQVYDLDALIDKCQQAGLLVDLVDGIGVFTELVPGIELERPGAMTALTELEAATSGLAPYRDIASRLHIIARRPAASAR